MINVKKRIESTVSADKLKINKTCDIEFEVFNIEQFVIGD